MTVLPKVTTPTFAKLSYHFILKLSRAILRKSFLPLAEKSLFHAMRKIMLQLCYRAIGYVANHVFHDFHRLGRCFFDW